MQLREVLSPHSTILRNSIKAARSSLDISTAKRHIVAKAAFMPSGIVNRRPQSVQTLVQTVLDAGISALPNSL